MNINACRPNYEKNINMKKDILCYILLNLSLTIFFQFLFQVAVPFHPFRCSVNSYIFPDAPACADKHSSNKQRFL